MNLCTDIHSPRGWILLTMMISWLFLEGHHQVDIFDSVKYLLDNSLLVNSINIKVEISTMKVWELQDVRLHVSQSLLFYVIIPKCNGCSVILWMHSDLCTHYLTLYSKSITWESFPSPPSIKSKDIISSHLQPPAAQSVYLFRASPAVPCVWCHSANVCTQKCQTKVNIIPAAQTTHTEAWAVVKSPIIC